MATYLLVIGDRAGLSWIVSNGMMAFPSIRRRDASALKVGDGLLLYTSRNCFNNPTRDRGRVVGEAVVRTPVESLVPPIELVGRAFTSGCTIDIQSLAPVRTGVELAGLVDYLDAFPNPRSWAIRLRRSLLPLTAHDARLLRKELAMVTRPPEQTRAEYLRWLPSDLSPASP